MSDKEKVAENLAEYLETCMRNRVISESFSEVIISLTKAEEIFALLKEQEAKTGYWIDSAGHDKCSICGEEYSDLYPDYGNTHFCPNCGAKMEGWRSE